MPQKIPSSMFVSQLVSSSSLNGGASPRCSEEEEEGVRVARQADLRRRTVGEQRQREPLVGPAQRLGERPQPCRRTLPAVGRHVRHAHRGRAVLQHDDVEPGIAHTGDDGVRTGQRQHQAAQRQDQAQPEGEVARRRDALPERQHAARGVAARVAPPAQRLPPPHDEQQRGRGQQPQVQRREKAHQPLRRMGGSPPGVGSSTVSRSSCIIGT